MSLPSEIWRIILQKTSDKKSCKNLYKSLPKSIQLYIEDDYINHYGIFKKLLCISSNKRILLYYKEKQIRILHHCDYVHNVRFRPNSNQIIFSDSCGNIYIWDYVTNISEYLIKTPRGRLLPFIGSIVKIYFHVSLCGSFMIVHPFPISDNQLYKFDIDTKKKTIIPFFPESNNTSFTVKFNPIDDEFTLLSYYFREIDRFQLKMNIIDNNTLISQFFTNNDYYAPYYDELGDLYVAKKNKGIFRLVNYEIFEQIFYFSDYITLFIVKNGIIYYVENNRSSKINIRLFNMVDSKKDDIYPIYSIPYESIDNLQISKDNKKLLFFSDCRILFFNLETNMIDKIITGNDIKDEKSSTNEVISDFCIKNFYNSSLGNL